MLKDVKSGQMYSYSDKYLLFQQNIYQALIVVL